MRNYGIDIDEYDSMVSRQNSRCAICETETPRGRGGFHVDHCHETGRVRGLLCAECNMALGLFKDNGDVLMKALNYLKQQPAAGGKAY